MAKVVLGMTMSADGFINDRNGSGEALYPDLAALRDTEPLSESIRNTGAVVMERFGYPDFISASADQLIDGQYADRPQLRPIFDAIIEALPQFGEVVIQARKIYVSLVSCNLLRFTKP